jgi:hypothetical protein
MTVLALIDEELAWWEDKCRSMKHPREQLALACAIGATTALRDIRDAIANPAHKSGNGKARRSLGTTAVEVEE